MKLAIYAGHGGSDPGAVSGDLREADINLAVMTELTRLLRQEEYEVINNRTSDVNRSIVEDARRANEENVDAVVELHMNSNEGIPHSGTEVYHSIFSPVGKELATAIVNEIADLGFQNLGAKTRVNEATGRDYFGIIRLSKAPANLVEMAFINNPEDMARFDVGEMAGAIFDGITQVFPLNRSVYPEPTGVLSWGARGDQVKWVQYYLQALGYPIGPSGVDGVFGTQTSLAVRAFQNDFGLSVDGIVGPRTKEALLNAYQPI